MQQQLLEAAKDKKEVTSHDLGREQGTPFDLLSLYNSPAFLKDQSVNFLSKLLQRWNLRQDGRGMWPPCHQVVNLSLSIAIYYVVGVGIIYITEKYDLGLEKVATLSHFNRYDISLLLE